MELILNFKFILIILILLFMKSKISQNESSLLLSKDKIWVFLRVVSKELNHLAAILHVYAGSLIFMKVKKNIIFQKEKGDTFTLLIIFIVKLLDFYTFDLSETWMFRVMAGMRKMKTK